MFEDINGNIGTVTRHEEHLTWARMYLHDGCWQGSRGRGLLCQLR